MVYPAWPPGYDPPMKTEKDKTQAKDEIISIRPKEIGDDNPLRVEDVIAWLEGMDPLKPVRIVMKTRDSTTESDIHTITENFGEGATVDIFPMKMPKDYQDLRQLLAEKAGVLADKAGDPGSLMTDEELTAIQSDDDDQIDEAQTILNAIRKRKQAAKDRDKQEKDRTQMSLETIGRKRERLRGAE